MRPASARRTRSPGAGRGAAPGPRRRTISAPVRPTSSARSVPAQGKGAGLVLPRCNSAAMALHLAEIAQTVTPGAHAVLLLDQAGWHLSDKLVVPGQHHPDAAAAQIARNSTRSRTSGSTCARTGSPTASSDPTRHPRPLLLGTVAKLGVRRPPPLAGVGRWSAGISARNRCRACRCRGRSGPGAADRPRAGTSASAAPWPCGG